MKFYVNNIGSRGCGLVTQTRQFLPRIDESLLTQDILIILVLFEKYPKVVLHYSLLLARIKNAKLQPRRILHIEPAPQGSEIN